MSEPSERTLHDDLAQLEERLEAAASGLQQKLAHAVDAQPLLMLGAATGIGFLLGGGVPRGSLTLLLGVGVRLAGAWLGRELLDGTNETEEKRS